MSTEIPWVLQQKSAVGEIRQEKKNIKIFDNGT